MISLNKNEKQDPGKQPSNTPTETIAQRPTQAIDPAQPTNSVDPTSPAITNPPVQLTAKDIMAYAKVYASASKLKAPDDDIYTKPMGFAMDIFKKCYDGTNTLVSPLSIQAALGMAAVGAGGNTLAQMEEALEMTREELILYISWFMNSLPENDPMSLANSIWIRDIFPIESLNRNFLQTNADHFKAAMYSAPFDDTTIKDINNWVNEKTREMIPGIIDEIQDNASIYIINALAFETKWENLYDVTQITSGTFTNSKGEKKDVTYMRSSEELYFADDTAQGFMKNYEGGKYAFLALLPNEGIELADFIASLSGEKYRKLIDSKQRENLNIILPEFEAEYEVDLKPVLQSMGMIDAFERSVADFLALGLLADGPTYINEIRHKTFISVDREGTKAAAVTEIGFGTDGEPQEINIVFDRPFIYMLVDTKTMVPFFVGAVNDI